MRDDGLWSISLGRWGGVRVRLHMFFLLFAAVTLYLSWLTRNETASEMRWVAGLSLLILLITVIIHEFGHHYAARRLGGVMTETALVPWGGISTIRSPGDSYSELIVCLAGPIANLLLCLICVPALLTLDDISLLGLLSPLHPEAVSAGSNWEIVLKLTFWINWLLVLVNLIPAFPFDGGRALQASLSLWLGRRHAANVVARVSQLTAVALLIVALFVRNESAGGVVPVWFALVLLGIFLLFSSRQEREKPPERRADEELFGYDFSQGYSSLERSSEAVMDDENEDDEGGRVANWLEQRRAARLKREQEVEAEEERRVDDILAQLHEGGMDSLSEEDRALLQRVSQRYRNRPGRAR